MKCKFCGYELYDDAVFCTNCGAKQPEDTESPAAEEENVAAAPDTSADENTVSVFDKPEQTAASEFDTPEDTAPVFDEIAPVTEEPVIEVPPMDDLSLPTPEPVEAAEPEPAYIPPVSDPVYAPPADEPAYIPPVAPAPSQEAADTSSKKVKKVGAGKLTLAGFITILSICFLIVGNMVLCVKFGLTGNVLSKRVKKLELNTILSAEYEDAEIAVDIYRTLGVRSMTEGEASETSFKAYLAQSDALDFIAGNVKNYADYILEGKGDDPTIDSDYIAEEFFGSKYNNKIAQREFDYSFTSKDLSNIAKNLRKNDVDEALSIREWNEEAGFNIKNFRHIFSYVSIAILFGIVVVFLICIILIVEKKGRHVMGFYSSIFSIAGLVTFIIGLALTLALPVVYTFSGNIVFYIAANLLAVFGAAALCAGFAEILLGCIFHCIKKSLKKKEKAAKAE